MKKNALIFLNGTYPDKQKQFYTGEYNKYKNESVVIVTDGGLEFFIEQNITPDILAGDLDSIDKEKITAYPDIKTVTVPTEGKSLTDGELALNWCIDNQIDSVIIYGGIDTVFETDHLLGNIFLMFACKNRFASIKMRDYCQEIIPLVDESYSGEGSPGDMLSIVPLSEEIVYNAEGLKYDPAGRTFRFGQTIPLRNELAESMFKVSIKGKAVLVRRF